MSGTSSSTTSSSSTRPTFPSSNVTSRTDESSYTRPVPVCNNCGKDNPGDARFCSGCGMALPTDATQSREMRKTVTVVFSDLAGSTSMGERLDPEGLRGLLTRYYDEMKQVLERHGGAVSQLVGDAVLAVFGAPLAHEDDALRAVRAASEMSEHL